MVHLKRIFSLIVLIVLITYMAGCKNTEAVNETPMLLGEKPSQKVSEVQGMTSLTPGWELHSDDKVKLDWYINYAWFTTPWGENLVSKTITEETGIEVNFIVPNGNETDKLNSLMGSDTLPDLLTLTWSEEQVGKMIDSGMVYALDELADKYDLYWYRVADPTTVEWFTREDGHIYSYPNYSLSPQDYALYDQIASNQTFLVRKDIYEAIGSPDMTTPEGFKDAVKTAVRMFPEIGGEPIIPIGAHEFTAEGNPSFDEYLANFLAIPYEKDNQYYDRYVDKELVKWLKTFRELCQEGYLAADVFIDRRTQMEEKIAAGRYFCMLYQRTDMAGQQKALYAKDPEAVYIAVDGPKNSDGDDYRLPGMGINGWTLTLISKNCEHPDRALELCAYLMSEHGQKMTWLGVEGVTWNYMDGVPTMDQDVAKLLETDRIGYDALYGADSAYWMFSDQVAAFAWEKQAAEPLGQMERWTYPYVINNSAYDITLPTYSQEAVVQSKIDREWGRLLPQLLLAESEDEFDDLWHKFIQKRNVWGVSQVLRKKSELMNEAKEKLGVQ